MADLLHQRYGDESLAPLTRLSETLTGQLSHRSVRAFTTEDVDAEDLRSIVAAAQSAPTSSNLQTWSVVAVRSQERRARLATLAGSQDFIARSPLFLVWVADLARAHELVAAAGRVAGGADFLETSLVAVIDAALAAQNALVAAESLGLGGVYVGAIRNRPEDVAAELDLPRHSFAVAGMAIGHPDPERPARVKPRLPQSAVLHHETYDGSRVHEDAESYDERIAAFYAAEGLPHSWRDRVIARLETPAALGGRERLREAWAALGLSTS